jgi:hypothetical protein
MADKRPAKTADTDYGVRVLALDPKCEGYDVWELQIKLIGWGSGTDTGGIGVPLDPVRVTGLFDRTTQCAVMRFQKAHNLPVTGAADGGTFREIDLEAARHPVLVHDFRCPCSRDEHTDKTDQANPKAKPILCRCPSHTHAGACTGFGKGADGGSLMTGRKIWDGSPAGSEITDVLDLYDGKEHAGVDKALLWALRAILHRGAMERFRVVRGYSCWNDRYYITDERRWKHDRSTHYFGKAAQVCLPTCSHDGIGNYETACANCDGIQKTALEKCGFQPGWQEPNRPTVILKATKAAPPAAPFAVHIDTVRRIGREDKVDDFVKTHPDGVAPLYPGNLGACYPVQLDDKNPFGLDPRSASSDLFYRNTEDNDSGWFPVGASRMWHGGVHFFAPAGKEVRAIADGEIVACRFQEADSRPYGSRNFVLLKHEWKKPDKTKKTWFSLTMHLAKDPGKAVWQKTLAARAVEHVEAEVPCPIFKKTTIGAEDRLLPSPGLGVGECVEIEGGELDLAALLDKRLPKDTKGYKIKSKDSWVCVKLDGKDVGKQYAAEAGLKDKIDKCQVIAGLSRPLKVAMGEILGGIGPKPSQSDFSSQTFVHIETFAAENLLAGDGYTEIGIEDGDVADRKKVEAKLLELKLIPAPADNVLLPRDLAGDGSDPLRWGWRAAVLKMKSAWAKQWENALAQPDCLKFLEKPGDLGKTFDEYAWWDDVKVAAGLPDKPYHFYPVTWILKMSFPE